MSARILVVEDQEDNRTILRDLLTHAGLEVLEAVTGEEGVRMAEAQYRARVVRTDVQDEDGRKVYVLKLLSEGGRVITVRIDAATGRMR